VRKVPRTTGAGGVGGVVARRGATVGVGLGVVLGHGVGGKLLDRAVAVGGRGATVEPAPEEPDHALYSPECVE
jgi:hypothetical protein